MRRSRGRRRVISREFKVAALREIEAGKSVAEVARACQVDVSMLHRWRVAWEKDPANAFSTTRQVSGERAGKRSWSGRSGGSFMKTLKHEEVHRCEYRSLEEAQQRIEQFVHRVYNQKRLHSALGYRSPVQFEQQPSGSEETTWRKQGQGAQTPPLTLHPIPAPN